MSAGQIIGTMAGLQVVGLDIGKRVFKLHTVDMSTGEIVNVQLKRAKVLEHFANQRPRLIAIEACGGAHHWARQLSAQGHTVRLLHAKVVRPFVAGNKTDATNGRAIWLAVQQPGVKFVGIKSTAQQATLTLHRQRELMMKMRTMQTNALRGLLYEFGVTFGNGRKALLGRWISWARRCRLAPFKKLAGTLRERLPVVVRGMLDDRSNAYVEAMNGQLQLAKRAARGFRTSKNFIAVAYLRMSKLKHLPPNPLLPATK